jgi:hypothetical protein
MSIHRSGYLVASVLGFTLVLIAIDWLWKSSPMPASPSQPLRLSPEPATDVDFKSDGDEGTGLPLFAHFAWKDFIALNWPAAKGARGVADKTKTFGSNADNVVWGTWKDMNDLFPIRAKPDPWDLPPPGKSKRLSRLAKLEDILQLSFLDGKLHPLTPRPLVAQNKTYVRYEICVNKVQYEYVINNGLYLNLPEFPKPLPFPDQAIQSIIVKAAWRELQDDELEKVGHRYYHIPAQVRLEDGNNNWARKEMGLVGIHIVHKTCHRQNWIWSTFEHVDNTELGKGGTTPPSFNSNDCGMAKTDPRWNESFWPAPLEDGRPKPGPPDPRLTPVEVARVACYNPALELINTRYWEHPEIKDTVWVNYRLVGVQWPPYPGNVLTERFPKSGVANAVIETYVQGITCMSCHSTAPNESFLFYLGRRVFGNAKDSGKK